jgi:hypothetical protein
MGCHLGIEIDAGHGILGAGTDAAQYSDSSRRYPIDTVLDLRKGSQQDRRYEKAI